MEIQVTINKIYRRSSIHSNISICVNQHHPNMTGYINTLIWCTKPICSTKHEYDLFCDSTEELSDRLSPHYFSMTSVKFLALYFHL